MLVADFQSEYHLQFEDLYWVMPWSRFVSRLAGLLAVDSRLHRFFRDPPESEPNPLIDDEL